MSVVAGSGTVQSIRFGTDARPLQNATVQIDGGNGLQQIRSATTVPIAGGVTGKTFTVSRTSSNQPMTVPMIVTDGCGPWETLVGLGTGQ